MTATKLYAERDAQALDEAGGYYSKHVVAMTSEKIHGKSDIAAELAHRDMVIDQLLDALEKLIDNYCPLTDDPSYQEQVEHWEDEKAQGRGDADIHLAAIAAVLAAKAGA